MLTIPQKPMRSVWQSLLWKEWHEHKWKLAVLALLGCLLPVALLTVGEVYYWRCVELVGHTVVPFGILAGLFVGMGTAAGEHQRETIRFLRTLPIPMRKPALVKWILSSLVVIAPILLMLLATSIAHPSVPEEAAVKRYNLLSKKVVENSWDGLSVQEQEEFQNIQSTSQMWHWRSLKLPFNDRQSVRRLPTWMLDTSICGALFVASLLLWMAACGVNHRDEVRAGAVGVLIMLLAWGTMVSLLALAEEYQLPWLKHGLAIPLAAAPGAVAFLRPLADELGVTLAFLATAAGLGHCGLAYWYLSRFGRSSVRPQKFGQASLFDKWRVTSSLASARPPLRSPLRAIVWKQFWETGPLALLAVVATIGLAALGYWAQNRSNPLHSNFGEVLGGVAGSVGFLVTIVAGIGVFLEDMQPQVGRFWRSRPIKLPVWFGVKVLTGLLVLVLSFGSLLLISYLFSDRSRLPSMHGGQFWLGVAWVSLMLLLLYTLAMTCYCLTQHAVIAAMIAIVLFFLGMFLFQWIPNEFFDGAAYPGLGLAALLAIETCLLAITWQTIRRDWSWRR
jgi:hypothetical protein